MSPVQQKRSGFSLQFVRSQAHSGSLSIHIHPGPHHSTSPPPPHLVPPVAVGHHSTIGTPPTPLTPAALKKVNMVGGNNCITHTYYLRSCKRKRLTDIESLPDELLFEVLVRLEAQHIYDSARLVCSKWYHMIHSHTFIYTHLQRSTYGLLFQSKCRGDSVFMAVGESGRVEIFKNMYNKLKCPVRTSCNGLVLECQDWINKDFYVSNPATRQIFTLPHIVGYLLHYEFIAIGYAAASMEYKAVVLLSRPPRMKKICFILTTIGVDNSWRIIDKESASFAANQLFFSTPLITEGFVHFYHTASNEVLTLNLETEIITDTSGPTPKGKRNQWNTYLSTGKYLSLLRPCGDFCWEVWEMKPKIDYVWRKVFDISLEAHKCSIFQRFGFKGYEVLIPTGWLKYPEILVFSISPIRPQVLMYNLLTREIVPIELPERYYLIVVHKESLVSLGGC
ncbi:hypothetical protein CASFOL_026488 [Castilleja foliolosa]|uniref:F-box domain-containing protein n=1 Tax=Castilleja foliolosa TaxID=1961234 RepID=A0ABD3CIW7_9LAMI